MLGGCLSMTYMIGPLLGGALVEVGDGDYAIAYYFSAGIAALGFTFAWFKLVEPEKGDEGELMPLQP
eukprot:UN02495